MALDEREQQQLYTLLWLKPEPMPRNLQCITLSKLSSKWDALRKRVKEEARWKCQICGYDCKSSKHLLDAHEIFSFYRQRKVYVLTSITAICKMCHGVKHYGFYSNSKDKEFPTKLIQHFNKVNKCPEGIFQIVNRYVLNEIICNKQIQDIRWVNFGIYSNYLNENELHKMNFTSKLSQKSYKLFNLKRMKSGLYVQYAYPEIINEYINSIYGK